MWIFASSVLRADAGAPGLEFRVEIRGASWLRAGEIGRFADVTSEVVEFEAAVLELFDALGDDGRLGNISAVEAFLDGKG